jgi:DNA-binding NarL/FixJ family response regulator
MTKKEEKTILIIEDNEDLMSKFQDYAGQIFAKVITSKTCKEAGNILKKEKINCILADNRLPDGLGISLIKEFKCRETGIVTIIITGYADKNLAIDSVNAGVSFFLEKPVPKQKLLEIFQNSNDLLVQKTTYQKLENSYQLKQNTIDYLKEKYEISDREIDVISFSLHNYKNTLIAKELFISLGTVKRHLHNIFEKMGISSKEELQKIIHKLNTSGIN